MVNSSSTPQTMSTNISKKTKGLVFYFTIAPYKNSSNTGLVLFFFNIAHHKNRSNTSSGLKNTVLYVLKKNTSQEYCMQVHFIMPPPPTPPEDFALHRKSNESAVKNDLAKQRKGDKLAAGVISSRVAFRARENRAYAVIAPFRYSLIFGHESLVNMMLLL